MARRRAGQHDGRPARGWTPANTRDLAFSRAAESRRQTRLRDPTRLRDMLRQRAGEGMNLLEMMSRPEQSAIMEDHLSLLG